MSRRNAQAGEPASPRVRVKRYHERGHYDRDTVNRILDDGIFCHIGFSFDQYPVVIPTLYWRNGDRVYWHGSSASRMMRAAEGADVCFAVTHLDGLVLTRSAFHHSANYRSVVLFGRPELVEDPDERQAQLRHLTERLFPGRWETLRPVKPQELKATRLLSLRIDECSAKLRTGGPDEDADDLDWPAWAGVIPLSLQAGPFEPDDRSQIAGWEPPVLSPVCRQP